MRKAIGGVLLCVLVTALFLTGVCAAQAENLITNGGFEDVSGQQPRDWTRGMWVTTQGASYLETSEDAYAGTYSVLVENVQENDARFEQVVRVEPDTLYRLSAYVKAEDIPSGTRGANLSFADVYETSESLYDTRGEWVYLDVYARTGKEQTQVKVMARVGGYSAINSGRAYFDELALEKVEAVPAGRTYISLATSVPDTGTADEADGEPGIAQILLLLAAGLLFAALIPYRKEKESLEKRPYTLYLAVALAAAFVLRAVLAVLVPGYEVDVNCFSAWSATMYRVGPTQFYQTVSFCDYPPAYLYVLWLNGFLIDALGAGYSGAAFSLLIKGVPILADVACAALIYWAARERVGEKRACTLGVLYAFCPATLIVSACWGQIDAVLIALLLLLLIAASRRLLHIALPLYFLAALTKPQAFLLAPLGICALFIVLTDKDARLRREALVRVGWGVLFSAVVAALVIVPFGVNQQAGWLIAKYAETLGSYNHGSLSTGNLMFLLGGNWVDASSASPLGISFSALGWALMLASIAYVMFLSLKARDLSLLFEHAALLLLLICTLGVKMHERYMLPVLSFLLIAFAMRPDRRTLFTFAACALTLTVNCGVVLLFEHLYYPNEWIGYLCGAVNLAACGLMGYTAFDHAVRGRVWALPSRKARADSAGEDSDAPMREALLGERAPIVGMRPVDWALMLGVTAVYALVAFVNLGATKAPQTGYVSTAAGESVTLDLSAVQEDFQIYYYGGISDVEFTFSVSEDGQSWSREELAEFNVGTCFRWMAHRLPLRGEDGELQLSSGEAQFARTMATYTGRYVRVTFVSAGAQLWEIACVKDGQALPIASALSMGAVETRAGNPATLYDEQDSVPDVPGYLTGTYFDEIYHARTAYEVRNGLSVYEYTHPPLGKLLMALGTAIFGMTPFGWRFMGTLLGALMLPLIYLMGKLLFRGKTLPSLLCTALLALDCMHFTQTRIATIDTYAVFFILAMYLCMLYWTRTNFLREPLAKTLLPLLLSGVSMAGAVSSKWTGAYACVGLAVIFFARLYALYRQSVWARAHAQEDERIALAATRFSGAALKTVLCCCVFFVLIPLIVYCVSFIPRLSVNGEMTTTRLWDEQVRMYRYHSTLVDDHFFKSPWWQWPLILKPMWYYSADFKPEGMISTILAFGNPAVWWTGFVAICYVLARYAFRRGVPLIKRVPAGRDTLDDGLFFVGVGFLSQFLPWVLVPRSMFIYHYFPSVPFIILAIGLCWQLLERRNARAARIALFALLGTALLLFIGFYPLATGTLVPRAWGEAMNWFGSWMYY